MQLLLDTALAGLRAMRTQDGTRDLSSHIEGLLRQSWSEHDAAALRGELIAELHRHDRLVEAEALLRTEVGANQLNLTIRCAWRSIFTTTTWTSQKA
jgi:hypothetical protein